jgi:hypothetical protein
MDPLLYKLLWIFGWITALLIVWFVRSSRRQRRLELIHAERLAAIEKGIPLPELPDYDTLLHRTGRHGPHGLNPRWPLGLGAIFGMFGVGICLALGFSGDEYHNQIWPFGLIPVFLGLGLALHYFLTRLPGK